MEVVAIHLETRQVFAALHHETRQVVVVVVVVEIHLETRPDSVPIR